MKGSRVLALVGAVALMMTAMVGDALTPSPTLETGLFDQPGFAAQVTGCHIADLAVRQRWQQQHRHAAALWGGERPDLLTPCSVFFRQADQPRLRLAALTTGGANTSLWIGPCEMMQLQLQAAVDDEEVLDLADQMEAAHCPQKVERSESFEVIDEAPRPAALPSLIDERWPHLPFDERFYFKREAPKPQFFGRSLPA